MSCNHDLVPDYLRTRPEPEVEEKMNLIINKANNTNPDTATVSLLEANPNKATSFLIVQPPP
jgi:hypothetical protein